MRQGPIVPAFILFTLAALTSLFFDPLRVLWLLRAADQACATQLARAEQELARQVLLENALADEEREGAPWEERLLAPEDEVPLRDFLVRLAEGVDMDLDAVRVGTRRTQDAVETIPFLAELRGDRADVPALLSDFYAQRRLVRFMGLEVEAERPGASKLTLRIQWEYGARTVPRAPAGEAKAEIGPPSLLGLLPSTVGGPVVDLPRRRVEARADELRALLPRLRALSVVEARTRGLRDRRRQLEGWSSQSESESRSLLRRLPELMEQMDTSTNVRASLRAEAGGALVIDEG